MAFSFFILLISFCLNHAANYPDNSMIDNSKWLDVDGNFIHAHGGQIYEFGDTFYLIGTTQKVEPNWLSEGINCYSSKDLMNWTFENEIFHNSSIKVVGYNPAWRIERPKILYNAKNNNFVLWFHLDTASFSLTSVAVAVSSHICGNYSFQSHFEPDGFPSYDMGLYQDGNKGYLVRSVSNSYAGISQLNGDYTNSTGIISKGPRMEGVTIFLLDSYYLFGSHLTGWSPNAAMLCTTKNTHSNGLDNAVWDNINGNACPNPTNSSTTFGSQSTYVVRFEDEVNSKYVFMAMMDIWNYPNVGNASYFWLPIVFSDDKSERFPSVPYVEKWKINDYAIDIPSS